MFGYVKPCISELKICDYELYKAMYCGLCRNLGENFGQVSRLSLNYDFTFLSILSAALTTDECKFEEFKCMVHPLKGKKRCLSNNYFNYTSNVAILMLYYKLKDNINDRGIKDKVVSASIEPYIKHLSKRAILNYPQISEALKDMYEKQYTLENDGCDSIDMAAEPTAAVMAVICECISNDPIQKRVLHAFGYQLGRWVYMIDATDDVEDDIKKGNYNPFAQMLNISVWDENCKDELLQIAKPNLYITLGELIKIYELLDLKRFQPIVDNIITMGLKETTDKIILKGDL